MAQRRGGIHVRIDGIARLRQRLEELEPQIIEALQKAVKESAEAVQGETERTVPVDHSGRDTHHLKDHVDIRYDENGLAAEVGWFDRESYYARFVEHGTRSIPPQPSLGPALELERTRYVRRLTEEVRAVLR
ncbi:HK97-gp10 family putative phage morphogenesis protein [Streptomyces sp. NPDC051014]|uniref:HK97-gp10 family putative phage morphogenesis protein n=1 Tax=Streptomyces sp. NPDC051014 TaxID=3155751 RepID=UPI0033CFC9DB